MTHYGLIFTASSSTDILSNKDAKNNNPGHAGRSAHLRQEAKRFAVAQKSEQLLSLSKKR